MKSEKPLWVTDCILQWASENQVSSDDYEASFINGGYYLYKKRTPADSSHKYIGSIKQDGLHPAKSKRIREKTCPGMQQSVNIQKLIDSVCLQGTTPLQSYEYGFSRTSLELTERIPEWKKFYDKDADSVLLSLTQTISRQSFTTLYFTKPEESKYPLGFARRYLDSLLPVSLSEIMSAVGNISIFQNANSSFTLSHLTDKQRDFFRKYSISLEV